MNDSRLITVAVWLSVQCRFPRWAVILFAFTYGVMFMATLLSLVGA